MAAMEHTCPNGHRFTKTSECRVCPVCEGKKSPNPEFPKGVSNPARRALESIGVSTLAQLSEHRRSELAALHGMGPKALRVLEAAMGERGLGFLAE